MHSISNQDTIVYFIVLIPGSLFTESLPIVSKVLSKLMKPRCTVAPNRANQGKKQENPVMKAGLSCKCLLFFPCNRENPVMIAG